MGIRWDATVSLGTVLLAVTVVLTTSITYTKIVQWLNDKFLEMHISVTRLDAAIGLHGVQLSEHAARMDRYENRYLGMTTDLQRIIGRMEHDRRGNGEAR